MSSPEPNQEAINGKLATPTSNSDVDENTRQDELFAEADEMDAEGGLFGSDEEDEGLPYNATLSTSL